MSRSVQCRARLVEQLLRKDALSTWLHGLVFKSALPSNRVPLEPAHQGLPIQVHSPLNLSTCVRLLAYLAEIGYPGYNLSQILVSIHKNKVNTSARPAANQSLTASEIVTWSTNVKQALCTAPFLAELSTLTAIFSRILPFAVIADDEVVPPFSSIWKCTMRLAHLPHAANCNCLTLTSQASTYDHRQADGNVTQYVASYSIRSTLQSIQKT